ncbi:hypothetical protein BCR33DRAFT_854878 [Rhizoclosmatium globosum]|uniref:F-box domain-containing protein n=1 Tax=Rhizoclosmatium globosum TaxID=329046 RepID=A0A1Y2BQI1_9FUNG|nr:hypothetical protein BCR33DRAFT_854878 [Rhizoclosmatium globosum]|eukprot:ORY36999.1 hypothetical protein BCR33DRAFT_854878 [Rhizoclosmatium globosum]
MNPSLVPHVDFGIIGESAWESLLKHTEVDPSPLDNIPATDPSSPNSHRYLIAKSIIVEQCLENARRLKPGTGKNKTITTETYMIKSSLMKLVESQNKYTHPTRATTGVPNGSIRRRRSSVEETLLKKQQGLLDLPHEIIYMVAYHYLDCNSVITLTRTNKILRGVLYTSQNLWQKLTMDRHGINYIEEGGDWRDACFNPDFYEFCCPHLSALSTIAVQERTEFLGKSSNTQH